MTSPPCSTQSVPTVDQASARPIWVRREPTIAPSAITSLKGRSSPRSSEYRQDTWPVLTPPPPSDFTNAPGSRAFPSACASHKSWGITQSFGHRPGPWGRSGQSPGPPRHFFLSFLGFSIVTNYRTYTLYLLPTTKATTNIVKRCEDVPQRFSFPPNAELAIRPSPPILMRWPWGNLPDRPVGSAPPRASAVYP